MTFIVHSTASFNECKTAQAAAFFLSRQTKNRMPHLKLMKLLYLADRESVREHGYPITNDAWVSMPHGPVLSRTLDLINGYVDSAPNGWEHWISDKENHEVALRRAFSPDELGQLSPADTEVLESVWNEFGAMSQWEIRDWTHDHCKEWKDPCGSSAPIAFEDMAKAVGYSAQAAQALSDEFEENKAIDRLFASL